MRLGESFCIGHCSGYLALIDLLLMMTGGGWIETAKMLSDMVIKKMMVSIPMQGLLLIGIKASLW